MDQPRLRRAALAGAVVLLSSACYGYVPAQLGSVAPGETVLLHLTRQGVADLPEQVPVQSDNALRGTLTRSSGDQVTVRVPLGVDRRALSAEVFGQDVVVSSEAIADLWRRRFSPVRTGIVVAGGLAVGGGLFYTFGHVANESGPGTPGEETIRIPLLSIFVW